MNDQQKQNTNDQMQYELCDLMDQYVRGELSAADTTRLQNLILNDPLSRASYVQYMRDSLNLSLLADLYEKNEKLSIDHSEELSDHIFYSDVESSSVKEGEQQKISSKTMLDSVAVNLKNFRTYMAQPIPLSMTIASLTLTLAILIMTQIYFNNQPRVASNPNDDLMLAQTIQVAEIVGIYDCTWDKATKPKKIGQPLYFGETLGISKGWVEIRLNRNSMVRLHNKSRIRLEGDNNIRLHYGKLAAIVPQTAKGFAVETDVSRTVDLGTEFGIQVDTDGANVIQVRKGIVEVSPIRDGKVIDDEKKRLVAGETIRISASRNSAVSVLKESKLNWIVYQPVKRYSRWLTHSKKMQADPDMIAYYTFQPTGNTFGMLQNQANKTAGQLNGMFGISDNLNADDKPRWTTGRWSSKKALRFDAEKKQFVIVDNFSKFQPSKEMSICAWVKVENDQGYHTIVAQWDDSLSPAGRFLYLALRNKSNEYSGNNLVIRTRISSDGIKKDQEPVLGLKQADRVQLSNGWVHVALTVKANGGPVRLYRNGKLVAEAVYPDKDFTSCKAKLSIGAMMHNKEHFHGLIDELAIFKRAITIKEIREMVEAGNPLID